MEVFVCELEYRVIDMGTIADLPHFISIVGGKQSKRTDFLNGRRRLVINGQQLFISKLAQ